MGYCTERVQRLREALEPTLLGWDGVTVQPLYGCPAYQVEGYLFAFLVDGGIVLAHLPQAERENLSRRYEVSEFQAGERIIPHWLLVRVEQPRMLHQLLPFVRRSYEATRFFARPF